MKVLTEHRSMQRETEALKRLTKHKNIVTFYGTEQEASVLYMCIFTKHFVYMHVHVVWQ